MWGEPKQATSATTSLFYLTVGSLVGVWSVVYYVYLYRHNGSDIAYLFDYGFFFTGLTLFVIGLTVGRIGLSARPAEVMTPPPQQIVAPPVAVATPPQPTTAVPVVEAAPVGTTTTAPLYLQTPQVPVHVDAQT